MKIDLKKKDFIWISLVIVLIGVGFVISLGSDNYLVHGHDAGELDVSDFGGSGEMIFGDWESTNSGQVGGGSSALKVGTTYRAATDGYAMGTVTGGNSKIYFRLGKTSSVSDMIVRQGGGRGESQSGSIIVPVPEGWYWRMTIVSGSLEQMRWLPVESGGSGSGSSSCTTKTCTTTSDATCTVTCDAGDTLSGGGVKRDSGSGTIDWMESYPNGNGWTCGLDDKVSTCYAICC